MPQSFIRAYREDYWACFLHVLAGTCVFCPDVIYLNAFLELSSEFPPLPGRRDWTQSLTYVSSSNEVSKNVLCNVNHM